MSTRSIVSRSSFLTRRVPQFNPDGFARCTRVARAFGGEIGAEVSRRCGDAETAELIDCLVDVLAERGYEPYDDDGTIRLRNCPFDSLAAEHRDLVCGMNLAVMEGATESLGASTVRPRLDPRPGCAACRSSTPADVVWRRTVPLAGTCGAPLLE
jgi:predicted ArsR family transcriptional regulator